MTAVALTVLAIVTLALTVVLAMGMVMVPMVRVVYAEHAAKKNVC